jgi:PAS domain S-box-containing protein
VQTIKVLVVDDSETDRALVSRALAQADEDYDVVEAVTRSDLESKLAAGDFDVVVSDYNILGLTGLEVLEVVGELKPDTPVVLLTGTGSEEIAVAALKRGAADYVVKSIKHIKKLPITVKAVLEHVALGRERETLAAALRTSEEKYRTLVETAAEAIVRVDGNETVTFFSEGAERMFGYDAAEVVGGAVTALVPASARELFARRLARHLAGNGAGLLTVPLVGKDGREFPVEISASRYGDGDSAYTAVIRDVTEKRRMEEEIARLERQAAIGEMTAGIAHEVRNPLAGIATSAAVARQDMAAAGLDTESADWILEGVHKIEGLLQRFFDFAKPLSPDCSPCDVNALVEEVLAAEARALTAAHVVVDADLAPCLPLASADASLLKAVFANVIVNARQVMSEGGNLTVRSASSSAGEDAVEVTFADTGPGLSAEEAKRALEPFYTTKGDGIGLGLPLCLKIVKAHGGAFELRGREVGAEVKITLPAGV